MKIIYHPHLNFDLNQFGIQVPLHNSRAEEVYKLLNLSSDKIISEFPKITLAELALTHSELYLEHLFSIDQETILNAFEVQLNPSRYLKDKAIKSLKELVEMYLLHTRAHLAAAEISLSEGIAFCLGGGMHHAARSAGRGFCLFNDIAVVINILLEHKKINSAWVIDVDAHKGDGTASLFQKKSEVTTLSVHMKNGWPLDGSLPLTDVAYAPSTFDIEVEVHDHYFEKLELALSYLKGKPDLCLVVLGADPYEGDALPSASGMQLTKVEMLKRDMMIYQFLKERKIPMCFSMAGGYGDQVAEIYAQFIKEII